MITGIIKQNITEVSLGTLLFVILVSHYCWPVEPIDSFLIIFGTIIGSLPVFMNAGKSLLGKEWASMDTLASLALIFSIIEQEFAAVVFISLMLSAARLLEHITESRMEQNIKSLMKLKPTTAKIERDGVMQVVPIAQVVVGDVVVVDTGERVPVDGIVISGEAAVDESSLTGESLPVDKKMDDKVASSTLMASGSLKIKTTKIGKDTTLEHIIALVESAREKKPDIETFGQKFGKFYLISIFIVSGSLFAYTQNVQLVLAVVLVVCADDIAVAIPLTYLRAIGLAAKRGVVIKGGKHLEVLGKVDTIVFDKTGTLTQGKPAVVGFGSIQGMSEKEVLTYAVPLITHSTHPLSLSLLRYAKNLDVETGEADRVDVIGGRGVVGIFDGERIVVGNRRLLEERGCVFNEELSKHARTFEGAMKSLTYIAYKDTVIGFFAFADEVKPGAQQVIKKLSQLGIKKTVMLSGDNERTAEDIAQTLGIDEFYGNLLPEDKVSRLKELSSSGVVAMVGDGVNDAAALSIAHVGIAMGGLGSDGAIESANIILMHDNLEAITETIELARSARKISIQDFYIWATTNAIGLAFVFLGGMGPSGAAAYNFISDFFPLANSLRVSNKK